MCNFHLHSDESRYSAYLLDQIDLAERSMRANAVITNVDICHYYNLMHELIRLTNPVLMDFFTLQNGQLCVS